LENLIYFQFNGNNTSMYSKSFMILFVCLLSRTLCIDDNANEVYSSLAQKHAEILNFSQKLRTTHVIIFN